MQQSKAGIAIDIDEGDEIQLYPATRARECAIEKW